MNVSNPKALFLPSDLYFQCIIIKPLHFSYIILLHKLLERKVIASSFTSKELQRKCSEEEKNTNSLNRALKCEMTSPSNFLVTYLDFYPRGILQRKKKATKFASVSVFLKLSHSNLNGKEN